MMIIIYAVSHESSRKERYSRGETVMKSILSALLAVAVLAGVAGSAYAAEDNFPRDFWEQQSRNLP
jgi:hypothetical protein